MRWLVTGMTVLLAAVFVALAGAGGWLYWTRVETRGEQATRSELGSLAQKQVPVVLGYDYQTVERSLIEASKLLTPDYRRAFEQDVTGKVIPEARERQIISQISVVGVGVMDAHRNSGSVMVYFNRTVSYDANRNQPLYEGSRVRVDYERVDGQWLINFIQPI